MVMDIHPFCKKLMKCIEAITIIGEFRSNYKQELITTDISKSIEYGSYPILSNINKKRFRKDHEILEYNARVYTKCRDIRTGKLDEECICCGGDDIPGILIGVFDVYRYSVKRSVSFIPVIKHALMRFVDSIKVDTECYTENCGTDIDKIIENHRLFRQKVRGVIKDLNDDSLVGVTRIITKGMPQEFSFKAVPRFNYFNNLKKITYVTK